MTRRINALRMKSPNTIRVTRRPVVAAEDERITVPEEGGARKGVLLPEIAHDTRKRICPRIEHLGESSASGNKNSVITQAYCR